MNSVIQGHQMHNKIFRETKMVDKQPTLQLVTMQECKHSRIVALFSCIRNGMEYKFSLTNLCTKVY